MSKGKIIAATILIILFAAFLFYRFFEFFKWQERKALGNGLSSYVLIGSKNIVVGKDIEPGYYDIKALEDHSGFFGRKMRENTTLHAVPLWENNRFSVAGKVELVPPVFGSVIQDENSLIIQNSGYYVVGEEIPEGDYILMKPEDDTCKVFVDIKNEKQNESMYTIQWDREISQPQGNAHIQLKNGYQIFVMVEDQNHYVAEHAKLVLEKKE